MEWEAILMQFPDEANVEGLPKHWRPPSLGSSAEVRAHFEAAFPNVRHCDGQTRIETDGGWVEFNYLPSEATDDLVQVIQVHSNADPSIVPALQVASKTLDCRLLDLQTAEYADFGQQTEASMREFLVLRSRVLREKAWAFGVAVVVVATIHGLQDSGILPPISTLAKPATLGYGLIGLILLNALAFLSSVSMGLKNVGQLTKEAESVEDRMQLEEAILVPTFQGQGNPPPFVARYLHVAIWTLLGVIAGSLLAFPISLLFL